MAFLLRVVIGGLNGHVVLATRTGRRVRRRGCLNDLQTEHIDSCPPRLLHGPRAGLIESPARSCSSAQADVWTICTSGTQSAAFNGGRAAVGYGALGSALLIPRRQKGSLIDHLSSANE